MSEMTKERLELIRSAVALTKDALGDVYADRALLLAEYDRLLRERKQESAEIASLMLRLRAAVMDYDDSFARENAPAPTPSNRQTSAPLLCGQPAEWYSKQNVEKIMAAARAGHVAWQFMQRDDRELIANLLSQNLNLRARVHEFDQQSRASQNFTLPLPAKDYDGLVDLGSVTRDTKGMA